MKARILIVDDDPGMTETLVDILSEMDYIVDAAGDGYEALEMISNMTFDVALMDIKMPGINGVETFKEVKKLSPSTKVIMMTAYAVEDLVKEALEEGAYAIIYKPLDLNKVLKTIEKSKKGTLILVVDDDPDFCLTLRDILDAKNYRTALASSGEEAIKFTEENHVDLIFIDIKLPMLNGLDTYLAVRKINPKVIAIMMTGYKKDPDVMKLVKDAIDSSAYTCLQKPLDLNNVIDLVEEITRKQR